MEDPVFAADGWSYERDAMAAYLKEKVNWILLYLLFYPTLYTLLTLSTPYLHPIVHTLNPQP